MIRPSAGIEVFLCREPVDFRKAINGLSIRVEEALGLDPFAARLYVFQNRKRDRGKVLYWERNGFVLWQKRLEKDRFPWREGETEDGVTRTGRIEFLEEALRLLRSQRFAPKSEKTPVNPLGLFNEAEAGGHETETDEGEEEIDVLPHKRRKGAGAPSRIGCPASRSSTVSATPRRSAPTTPRTRSCAAARRSRSGSTSSGRSCR